MVYKLKNKPKKKQIKQTQKQNQYVNQIVKIYLDERKTKRRIPRKKIQKTIVYQNPLLNMYPLQQPYNPFFYPRRPPPPSQTKPPIPSFQFQQTTQRRGPTEERFLSFKEKIRREADQQILTESNPIPPFPDLQNNNPLPREPPDDDLLDALITGYVDEEPREEGEPINTPLEAEANSFPNTKEDIKMIVYYTALRGQRRGRRPKTREGYRLAIKRMEEEEEPTFNKTI